MTDYNNDDVLVADAAVIGKPMLDAIKKLAKERNLPLAEFFQPAYQAFLVIGGILLEDDPVLLSKE